MKIVRKIRRISRWLAGRQVSPLVREIKQDGLTYLSNRKLLNIERCLSDLNAKGIAGDILEFGVALGGSGIILARQMGDKRRYYGFDVFGMIPPPNSNVDSIGSLKRYEEIISGKSKGIAGKPYYGYEKNLLDKVRLAFHTYGLENGEQIRLVEGLFEETWPIVANGITGVALIHIDCDWHDPVAFCLQSSTDKLATGGYIVVDDYYDYEGARKAVDEFLERNNQFAIAKNSENLIIIKHG